MVRRLNPGFLGVPGSSNFGVFSGFFYYRAARSDQIVAIEGSSCRVTGLGFGPVKETSDKTADIACQADHLAGRVLLCDRVIVVTTAGSGPNRSQIRDRARR